MSDLGEQGESSGPVDYMVARRQQAIKRIKEKNDFKIHLMVYLAVNAMLVFIWAFSSQGFFWPIFPIVGWGIGVVINGYVAYRGNIYTEERIQREMEKLP
jgi:hypothetical protein